MPTTSDGSRCPEPTSDCGATTSAPDVVVIRSGLDLLKVPVPNVLQLAEVTSPGNFRQDRIVKHNDYAEAGVPF